ncbi:uncharacterized protein TNCV_4034821 [Trichonephila clavipes]|nr:uncharacterized protein TNCV_4034821 [Trichonephila clavipes]
MAREPMKTINGGLLFFISRNSIFGLSMRQIGKTAPCASHCSATRGPLETNHVILNHGQVTWTTPVLAAPLLNTAPHQQEDVEPLGRFKVHRCGDARRVFSGTGLELMTCLP